MKKKITILMLVITSLVWNMPMQAKTTNKSKTKTKKTSIIGSFYHTGSQLSRCKNLHLLSNGEINTGDRCITGSYKRGKGGEYRLNFIDKPSCGDFDLTEMIVGKDVYYIWAGTDPTVGIDDFFYNPLDKTVTFDFRYPEDIEFFLEVSGFKSLTVPLSTFKKVGKVTWKK